MSRRGTLHAQSQIVYLDGFKPFDWVSSTDWLQGPFVGVDQQRPTGFFAVQQNIGTLVLDPTKTDGSRIHGGLQQVIQVSVDGTKVWSLDVIDPLTGKTVIVHSERISDSIPPLDISAGYSVVFTIIANPVSARMEIIDSSISTRIIDRTYYFDKKYAGLLLSSMNAITGYGSDAGVGDYTVFSQVAARFHTNLSEPAGISTYGLPGDSSDPMTPALPVFNTAESSNTHSDVVYCGNGEVIEDVSLGSWQEYLNVYTVTPAPSPILPGVDYPTRAAILFDEDSKRPPSAIDRFRRMFKI